MKIELKNDHDMSAVDFWRGTTCAVCGQPIDAPPALWLVVQSIDFYLHKHCEPAFTPETVKRHVGDMVLVMQDRSLHDTSPDRN